MTTTPDQPLLIPICRYIGEHYDLDRDDSTFQVRGGREVIELTRQERDIWALTHGLTNKLKQGVRWTRESALEASGPTRDQVNPILDQLIEKRVLAEVLPGTEAAIDFARQVRLAPLQLGVGNTKEKSWVWRVGSPTGGVEVSELLYQIWDWGYLHQNLWEACTELAKLNSQNYDSPDEVEECDPAKVLTEVLTEVHLILSATCGYFDRPLDTV